MAYWIKRGSNLIINRIDEPLVTSINYKSLIFDMIKHKAIVAIWKIKKGEDTYRCIFDDKDFHVDTIKSSNARNSLRKALNRSKFKEFDFEVMSEKAYKVYCSSVLRYKDFHPLSYSQYMNEIHDLRKSNSVRFFGVFNVDNKLISYMTTISAGKILFGHEAYFNFEHKSDNPMWALYYNVALLAIREGYSCFDRGDKPLVHPTNIDEFLVKLGFRFDYCSYSSVTLPGLRSVIRLILFFDTVVANRLLKGFSVKMEALQIVLSKK